MTKDADKVVQWAIEIADNVPEKYQTAAFSELLRFGLQAATTNEIINSTDSDYSPDSSAPAGDRITDTLPDEYVIATKGTREQQAVWAVVELCNRNEEATARSVMELIKTHLRIQPESRPNTSTRLGDLTPQYLLREDREAGRGYAYKPTLRAVEIFEGLTE